MDVSIRRITSAERNEGDIYSDIFAQLIAEQEAEYEDQFGAEYRAVHPFTPSLDTHRQVMKIINQRKDAP